MTNDRITRRELLGATAITGSLGLASGGATNALLGDRSRFEDNAATGGTLDLLVAAAADVDPDTWSPTPSTSGSGASVTMDDPCGTIGLAFTVCGNPGTVSLSTVEDEAASTVPASTDEPFVTLFTGDCTEGRVLTAGWLSTVRADLATGVPLHPESSFLGRIDEAEISDGAEVTFDHDGTQVTVGIGTIEEGGETVGVDLAVDGATLSQVDVKGGGHPFPDPCAIPPWVASPGTCSDGGSTGGPPGGPSDSPPGDGGQGSGGENGGPPDRTGGAGPPADSYGRRIGVEPYQFDCATTATDLRTRDDGDTGVSHVDLYVCERQCFDCESAPPSQLFLSWAGATAEHTLDLEFSAVQCRHVATGGER